MKVIIVDDENWGICQMREELEQIQDVEICASFEDGAAALRFAGENEIDAALLDIEMPFMSGLELGRRLRELYPQIILVYVTGYDDYIKEAILELKAEFYLLKPYNHEDIANVIEKCKALCSGKERKDVEIRCFGGFEVYIGGKLIHFSNRKAKELLALCVHMNGKHVTLEKAVDTLWENHPYDNSVKSLYRKAVIYLNAVFRDNGVSHVFDNGRGYCCINRDKVKCEYFDYLDGTFHPSLRTDNAYMQEYSWSEGTILNFE